MITKLFSGEAIFLNYWLLNPNHPFYDISILPGEKEGISTSCIGGYNIGINKYSSKEKQKAALEILKFITSKDIQKEYSTNFGVYSGISSLYDDEEVCNIMNCELYKSLQPLPRPTIDNENYDEYSFFFRNYIYEYIFGNATVDEALNNIINLRKIYSISLNTKDSSIGLSFFIILCFIICLMILSLIFIFIPSYKPYFEFLPNDFWILSILGIIMILCMSFTELGDITVFKCHLRLYLLSIGFSLNMITCLYKLTINFPKENKFSRWVEKHRYFYLLTFIFIDLLFNGLLLIHPYSINTNQVEGEKKFQYCKIDNTFSKMIEYLFVMAKVFVYLNFLFLIFIEWNMKNTYYDVRTLTSVVYIDALSFILLLVINALKINDYIAYFLIKLLIYFVYGISNYSFIYGYKIIYCLINKYIGNGEKNYNVESDTKNYSTTGSEIFTKTDKNNDNYSFQDKHESTSNISKYFDMLFSLHNLQEKENNTPIEYRFSYKNSNTNNTDSSFYQQ